MSLHRGSARAMKTEQMSRPRHLGSNSSFRKLRSPWMLSSNPLNSETLNPEPQSASWPQGSEPIVRVPKFGPKRRSLKACGAVWLPKVLGSGGLELDFGLQQTLQKPAGEFNNDYIAL